jgi:hypothetical protein
MGSSFLHLASSRPEAPESELKTAAGGLKMVRRMVTAALAPPKSGFLSRQSHFEEVQIYFELLQSHFESAHGHFGGIFSYFDSLYSHFELVNSHFELTHNHFVRVFSHFCSPYSRFGRPDEHLYSRRGGLRATFSNPRLLLHRTGL